MEQLNLKQAVLIVATAACFATSGYLIGKIVSDIHAQIKERKAAK